MFLCASKQATAAAGLAAIMLAVLSWLWPQAAAASCAGMVSAPPLFMRAAATPGGAIPSGNLRITYVGHSSFEVESPRGARIVTDYNSYNTAERLPHIVTMNNAHDTHYTDFLDPGIKHVLRGWKPGGGIARHNIKFRDVRVRNVPTNLQNYSGQWSNGNSMFVIEASGLCVVHISHLHHVLSPEQLRELGLADVAFAPIDGMWTMSHEELFEVLDKIKPRLIIPMHYGSMDGMGAFIARAKPKYEIVEHTGRSVMVNFRSMPKKTQVLFLQGY